MTLNRPDRLNALNGAMVNELLDRLRDLAGQPEVRVVVLTGAGRGFCAGGDVASLAGDGGQSSSPGRTSRELMEISELLHGMAKPTIAWINGPCAGGGLSFAAAADIRLAAESAVFATAYLRVGIPGDHGGIWTVTRAVGSSRARALFLLGDRFTAQEAERIGLVHAVLPDAALAARVGEVAARLAAASPAALDAMKANLNDAETLPLAAYLDRETERFVAVLGSEDSKEAARAFLEKRPAVFEK